MNYRFLIFLLMITPFLFAEESDVRFFIGDVHFKTSAKQSDWIQVQLNQKMEDENVIRTGKESRCELRLSDGSIVNVFEYSMLQLNTISAEHQETNLFALLGKFYFKVKKMLNRKFSVKSPASLAAVRGTEFLLTNTSTESELWVRSGSVVFSGLDNGKKIVVYAGQKSKITKAGLPSQPKALSEAESTSLDNMAMVNLPEEENTVQINEPVKKRDNDIVEKPSLIVDNDKKYVPTEVQTDQYDRDFPQTDDGFRMGLAIGAVTLDNQLYNQIGIRPIFSIGKLGIALDLTLYIDEQGNIREDNWDSFNDIIEKLYYVRWGLKGDPFYTKIGAIDNYRLGYGILMNRYSNTIEYPSVIRTGMELGLQNETVGLDFMSNNFKELGRSGGLFAGRISYKLIGNLEIGASAVYDRNQFAALADRDDDGVPDALDDFPGNKDYSVDTDGDHVPDIIDPDRDGDGYTDNSQDPIIPNNDPDFDPAVLKPDPFNIKNSDKKDQLAYAVDIGYPIIDMSQLQLILYSQAARFDGGGWGVAAPGFLAKFAFINLYGEYRFFNQKFIPEYFNTTYEIERAVFIQEKDSVGNFTGNLIPYTKGQLLETVNERLRGFMVGADFNILDLVIFGAEYQHMNKSKIEFNTFRANLDFNTQYIPKIQRAGAYFYQQNVNELFKRQEGTILGYRLQYEISAGAALLLDYRKTYRDLNGDGRISGKNETITTTNIQTVFMF